MRRYICLILFVFLLILFGILAFIFLHILIILRWSILLW